MAASMVRNVKGVSTQCQCHRILFAKVCSPAFSLSQLKQGLSTLPHGETLPKEESRTNWSLDTQVASSHRRHAGVRQVKLVGLPRELLSNITAVLEDQTVRDLVAEARGLSNYLLSRKRPVEELELRAAARHFSQELGLEDLDEAELKSQSVSRDTQRKVRQVMTKLRKNLYRWKSIEYDDTKSLAYMLARMAPNYAVLCRVLNEIKCQDPNFHPRSILDFGSGVGTTVWAAHSLWEEAVKEYYLVDSSKSMHRLAERLLQVEPRREGLQAERGTGRLHVPNVYHRFFMPVSLRSRYDVTVSAYSLLELPSLRDRASAVRSLWRATDGYMVLVESGSYESYLALMEVRDVILRESKDQSGDAVEANDEEFQESSSRVQDRLMHQADNSEGHVFAPCPHDETCPRLLDGSGTPCNFEQSYHPLPQYVGPRSSGGPQSERFCYVILKKGARVPSGKNSHWPRVVRPVLRRSRHVICRLCRQDGRLGEAVITKAKHSRDLYLCARYTNWGDLFPAAQTDRETEAGTNEHTDTDTFR